MATSAALHPAVAAALAKRQKAIRWWLVIAVVAVLLLFVLLALVAEAGIGVLPLAIVLAFFPLPFYLGYALWIDHYEPEPRWLYLLIFVWGALVAFSVALIVNTLGSWAVGESLGGHAAEIYGGSISAPFVEEGAKAAVLLLIFRRHRELFNGPLDGAVYAILVGLGFAITEDALYYVRGAAEHGVAGEVGTFVVRGVLSPFGHPLYTAMTGIGLGIAATTSRRWLKIAAPVVGYLLAVSLHSLWNTTAGTNPIALVFVYLLFYIPLLWTVVVIGLLAMRREGRIVREYLPPDVVSPEEVEQLYGVRKRLRSSLKTFRKGGIQGLRDRGDYRRAVSHVAFDRYREAQRARRNAEATPA